MADVLRVSNEPPFDLITWVPLHPIRKWRRGYDQAELLTREIANAAEVSATRTLRKVRYTRAQSRTLAKFRQQNVADVYRVISPSTVQGRRILLIDDVITTGSTLENAAAALRRAGAAQVICLTLARSSYDI
jgi:ComF family protein